jgi:hypothetical protein
MMWRSFTQYFAVSVLVSVVSVVSLASDAVGGRSAGVADFEPVLELRTGDVDTSSLPSLLAAPPDSFSATTAYVLQLDGPITRERRAQLGALGVQLFDYLPMHAYIVGLEGVSPAALANLGFVAWLGEYQDSWKIDPQIGQREYFTPARQALAARDEVIVDIVLFDAADVDAAIDAILAIDGVVAHRIEPEDGNTAITATMPIGALPLLSAIDGVQFVEEAPEVTLRNGTNRWIVQSNVNGSLPLYDRGIHGEGQILGMMDGKLDMNHCSFRDNTNNTPGPAHRKVLAYNTSLGADTHGTHTSGTTVGDNGVDDNTRGIAYLGKLVFDDIPSFTDTAMYSALSLHHSQGARDHSNSWGNDGTTSYDGLCRGIDRFSYDFEDSLVYFAVTNLSALKNPENAKNLVAVGASQDTPNQGSHCSGGTGPTADGRRKPEIYAPGCGTNSSAAGTSCSTTALTGTSMACPAVCGTGMLVRQYYADGFYPSGMKNASDAFTPTGALVKATLLNSAVDMTGVTGYPSNQEGWGRVLANDATYFSGETRKLVVQDVRNANGLSTGEQTEYNVNVATSAEKLKITLVWTEPPDTAGAANPVVNNLDLEVLSPSALLYLGNVFSGGVSTTGGTADPKNNVEQVHVNSPEIGNWTVRIKGTDVSVGRQGYALVVTGDVTGTPPAFTISLPNGAPGTLPPGVPTDFDVQITPGTETIPDGNALLYYRYTGGAYQSVALVHTSGDLYTATLPAPQCSDTPEFYVSATGNLGTTLTLPSTAPALVYSAVVGTPAVPYEFDMETDPGWTVGAPGDTATGGIWVRVDPLGTTSATGVAVQPENDHTPTPGTQCWVTGQGSVGGTVGEADVDAGATTLTTNTMDMSSLADPMVSYWRWYSNAQGGAPNADVFVVDISNDDGSNWVNVETVGPSGTGTNGTWIYHAFRVKDFIATPSSQVKMRFVASDFNASSLVEAAIDDFRVDDFSCTDPATPCPGDTNGDQVVDNADLQAVLDAWASMTGDPNYNPDADLNDDGTVENADLQEILDYWANTCP